MADEQIALAAHLMRRAGVGATRDEVEAIAARPYEDVVEELLTPEPGTCTPAAPSRSGVTPWPTSARTRWRSTRPSTS
jgi:hypothetical protein